MNKDVLICAGINYEAGTKRFLGNETTFQKFLGRFLNDKSLEKLKDCLEKKDYENAFVAAHTLKGTCGNLAIDGLYNVVCPLVEALRHNEYNDIDKLIEDVVSEYDIVVEAISN